MLHEVEKLLSPKEKEDYNRWIAAHNLVCGCGRITLHLKGSAIGTMITINCSTIEREHDLTDYDSW